MSGSVYFGQDFFFLNWHQFQCVLVRTKKEKKQNAATGTNNIHICGIAAIVRSRRLYFGLFFLVVDYSSNKKYTAKLKKKKKCVFLLFWASFPLIIIKQKNQ